MALSEFVDGRPRLRDSRRALICFCFAVKSERSTLLVERPYVADPGRPLTISRDATGPPSSHASFDVSSRNTPLPKPPKSLYNHRLCGRRIMAITLASQARDVGSIPIARSSIPSSASFGVGHLPLMT